MVDIINWENASTTAANNLAVAGVSIAEGWLPSTVNNAYRADWAVLAKFWDEYGGVVTVAGTADAITITTPGTHTALSTGLRFIFKAGADNTTAVTLNLDAIGAKAVRKISGGTDAALNAGDIRAGNRYDLVYDAAANAAAGAWIIVAPAAGVLGLGLADLVTFGQVSLPSGGKVGTAIGSGNEASIGFTNPNAIAISGNVTTAINLTSGQIAMPAVQVPSGGANTWDDYAEGSFTGTLTGVSGSVTITIDYVKNGKTVIVSPRSSGSLSGTSNATTKTLTGMPARIFPANAGDIPHIAASDNGGAVVVGRASIALTGVISFFSTIGGGAWTASGTAAIILPSFSYVAAG